MQQSTNGSKFEGGAWREGSGVLRFPTVHGRIEDDVLDALESAQESLKSIDTNYTTQEEAIRGLERSLGEIQFALERSGEDVPSPSLRVAQEFLAVAAGDVRLARNFFSIQGENADNAAILTGVMRRLERTSAQIEQNHHAGVYREAV